ncbi:glycoprotein-N-acetylgalactosamine 3-beta-galactosyltransferase 1-like isoform X2 [Hyalella azteca]|uniref:Glycoprotein-N-acetylgalactosamine 3-beta-galactosyltransferase 1 n=1 Tax=Hyalella azteca TaxID=294128 RepID=A0A8B7P8E7_HYAAZ|nr:glycoprotein-N-acetylgalactosamine 3-beta-galactosyltransferase 1-like isoform X2 [Hyalella azteca]
MTAGIRLLKWHHVHSAALGVTFALLAFVTLDTLTVTRYHKVAKSLLRRSEFNFDDAALEGHPRVRDEHLQQLQNIKLLVWVMTQPDNHQTKAVHVRDTWGKRVDKLLFMSTKEDASIPTIKLNTNESRTFLWAKFKRAFKYVHQHYINDYDWFIRADDDTYLVVENLRYMLSLYDPEFPIHFGQRYTSSNPEGYMTGGAGFVISRAALRKFVEEALPDPQKCRASDIGEDDDVEVGRCLTNVGVVAGDSRDELGRGRFFYQPPADQLSYALQGNKSWEWPHSFYPPKLGPDWLSSTAISFHHLRPDQIDEMDYLLYHVRPFGVELEQPFPPVLPPDIRTVPMQVIEKFGTWT